MGDGSGQARGRGWKEEGVEIRGREGWLIGGSKGAATKERVGKEGIYNIHMTLHTNL